MLTNPEPVIVTKSMIEIEYMGKKVMKEVVVPGVVKAGNAYLIRCSESGEHTYCNEERLAKLIAKFGTIENLGMKYIGRNGKQTIKKAAAAAKALEAPATAAVAAPATEAVAEPNAEERAVEQNGKRKGKKNATLAVDQEVV